MKLCISCRHIAQADAAFCPVCGRTFGGVRCPSGHITQGKVVHCCAICGSRDLTQGTESLELGCISRIVAWALALVLLRFTVAHLDGLWQALVGLSSFVIGEQHLRYFLSTLESVLCIVVALWIVQLMLGRRASELVPAPKLIGRCIVIGVSAAITGVKYLVFMVERQHEQRQVAGKARPQLPKHVSDD